MDPIIIDNLVASPVATDVFTLRRFASEANIPVKHRPRFSLVHSKASGLTGRFYEVFVDPTELSFANFENILNLQDVVKFSDVPAIKLCKVAKGILKANISELPLIHELLNLDKLNLYNAANNASRGGKRFIFKHDQLATKLSEALRETIKLTKGFVGVNSVFRYNKFAPGDGKFSSHYDTPYSDGANMNFSIFTVIIYLTEGSANPALQVDTTPFNTLDAGTMIVFDQKYEHEGRPFEHTDKIFIRSELIFHRPDLKFKNEASIMFTKACYLEKQALHTPELKRASNIAFNHAVQLRHELAKTVAPEVTLLKVYKTVPFLTNGHDYWFLKNDEHASLLQLAKLVLLDYFNGTCEGALSFNQVTTTMVVKVSFNNDVDRLQYLSHHATAFHAPVVVDAATRPRTLAEGCNLANEDWCCPFHNFDFYNPLMAVDSVGDFDRRVEMFNEKLDRYSVSISREGKIWINEKDFKVDEIAGQISFVTSGLNTRFNFAACWNGASSSVKLDPIETMGYNLPPIYYSEIENGNGYLLNIDMFHNGYILSEKQNLKQPLYPRIVEEGGGMSDDEEDDSEGGNDDEEEEEDEDKEHESPANSSNKLGIPQKLHIQPPTLAFPLDKAGEASEYLFQEVVRCACENDTDSLQALIERFLAQHSPSALAALLNRRDDYSNGSHCTELSGGEGPTFETPLHFATFHGHEQVSRLLLQYGARVNRRSATQQATPLLYAAAWGHFSVVQMLCNDFKANFTAKDVKGCTALGWAVKRDLTNIAHFLYSFKFKSAIAWLALSRKLQPRLPEMVFEQIFEVLFVGPLDMEAIKAEDKWDDRDDDGDGNMMDRHDPPDADSIDMTYYGMTEAASDEEAPEADD